MKIILENKRLRRKRAIIKSQMNTKNALPLAETNEYKLKVAKSIEKLSVVV